VLCKFIQCFVKPFSDLSIYPDVELFKSW